MKDFVSTYVYKRWSWGELDNDYSLRSWMIRIIENIDYGDYMHDIL